jgi:catechol 2,3-dioxygenase-like lactoylglutathione lyase family enzyme
MLSLHHVQICILPEQEQAARDFYCGLMGLPEVPKPPSLQGRGGFWLQIGDQQVHVGLESPAFPSGKAHIAYQVDDLPRWRQRLVAFGLKVLESIPIPGFDRFETRDPFGNRMEFLQCIDIHP